MKVNSQIHEKTDYITVEFWNLIDNYWFVHFPLSQFEHLEMPQVILLPKTYPDFQSLIWIIIHNSNHDLKKKEKKYHCSQNINQ